MTRWIRSQRATAIDVGEDLVLVGRDGVVRRIEGDGAALAREVLAYVGVARTADDVIAHVESLAGPLGERRAVVEQLIEALAAADAIREATRSSQAAGTAVRGPGANIVVGITGAIAATHAPALVGALLRRGHAVEVALTPTAARFVSTDALAAIVQRAPHTSLWPAAPHAPVPHVALGQWADLVIVYPASATTLARLAHGDFSELVAATALATRAPVVIVPSMNDAMLDAPAVQHNLARLREDGHAIVHGVPSVEVADAPAIRSPLPGAAAAPSEIVATVEALLASRVLSRRGASVAAARDWDAAYRRPLVPWASDACDPDLAAALERHARPGSRVLDVGCGFGQVARHAAAAGHHVVATDISEVALAAARTAAPAASIAHAATQPDARSPSPTPAAPPIVWLRDDICATALVGPFDVIVDRATLHALPPHRLPAWTASIRKLLADDGTVILECHRDGIPGVTTGHRGAELAERLGLAVISEDATELPHPADGTPIPALLIVLGRRPAG